VAGRSRVQFPDSYVQSGRRPAGMVTGRRRIISVGGI
jgi:hypothetical protein